MCFESYLLFSCLIFMSNNGIHILWLLWKYLTTWKLHIGSTSSVEMGAISAPLLVVLVFCCLVSVSQAEYLKYKDPTQSLDVRIKDLLQRMTLEEKIGQMVQIERSIATPEVMKKYFIGKLSPRPKLVPYVLLYYALYLVMFFFSLYKCMICLIQWV